MGIEGALFYLVYFIAMVITVAADRRLRKLRTQQPGALPGAVQKQIRSLKISRAFGIAILLAPILFFSAAALYYEIR